MVNPRTNPEEPENLEPQQTMEDASPCKGSEYEQSREERIKENRERMQKLGILDLSLKLNSLKPSPIKKRSYNRKASPVDSPCPLPRSGPIRRSSRLQNSTPVSYCEVPEGKNDKSLNGDDIRREIGSKTEVYTEEHEKLLGSTEMDWTLFVDGYGKDGKRIYDPVRGKTCHQCRQKTLGHRTHCCECNMVQGQFCGDCLYMRYGENVLEANANPNWKCPVCRGICNCSLCRQGKGWPATGSLYRKISSLGYKSVAHYLVQTRRSSTDSDAGVGTEVPTSAKRSLPFSDVELTPGEDDLSKSKSENVITDPEKEVGEEFGDSKMAPETGEKALFLATPTKDQTGYPLKTEPEKSDSESDQEKEDDLLLDSGLDNRTIDLETSSKPEPEKSNSESDKEKEAAFLVDSELDKITTDLKMLAEAVSETINYSERLLLSETLESGNANDIKEDDVIVLDKKDLHAHVTSPKSTRKHGRVEPTTPDSIAARMKMRRRN